MFDFDGALKEVRDERRAKADAEAARRKMLEERTSELYVPLLAFIDKEKLDTEIDRHTEKLILRRKRGDQIEVTVDNNGLYRALSKGSVYAGYKVDGSELREPEITKILVAWMTVSS